MARLIPQLHAIELLPDAAGEAAVRAGWQALHDAGLPSTLDHTGASNTPHVTVIAVPAIRADDELAAVDPLERQLASPVVVHELGQTAGGRSCRARCAGAEGNQA